MIQDLLLLQVPAETWLSLMAFCQGQCHASSAAYFETPANAYCLQGLEREARLRSLEESCRQQQVT